MSKERALRRAEREREQAIRAAARAAQDERRERKAARARALKAITTDKLPKLTPVGSPTGSLARKRRLRSSLLGSVLVALNILVWFVSPDWALRLGALVVTVLVFPVLKTLLFPRRL